MNKPLAFILASFSWITLSMHAAELKHDIEYGHVGDEHLLLDAHSPDGDGLHPVAILVHGGGLSHGDKSGLDEPTKGADITSWFAQSSDAGFTWFSINYRLAPAHRWPDGFDDVQTAIRWVKVHVAEFKGDSNRIALFGHSSGDHYVCLAGVLADETTRVQAIVSFAGVTDLEADATHRGSLSPSLQSLFDRPAVFTPEVALLLREHSPITHVRTGLPPFLLLHGDADKTVPYRQALDFQQKLRAAGVHCDLITIPGAPHGLLHWAEYSTDYNARLIAWLQANLTASPSGQMAL